MGVDLIVIAVLFVPGIVDGRDTWTQQAYLHHQMPFESRAACEQYMERRGDDIAEYLEDALRDHWKTGIKLQPHEMRFELHFDCYDVEL